MAFVHSPTDIVTAATVRELRNYGADRNLIEYAERLASHGQRRGSITIAKELERLQADPFRRLASAIRRA